MNRWKLMTKEEKELTMDSRTLKLLPIWNQSKIMPLTNTRDQERCQKCLMKLNKMHKNKEFRIKLNWIKLMRQTNFFQEKQLQLIKVRLQLSVKQNKCMLSQLSLLIKQKKKCHNHYHNESLESDNKNEKWTMENLYQILCDALMKD